MDNEVDLNETVDSGVLLERTLGILCPLCGLEVTGGFTSCPNDGTRLIPDPGSDSALSDRYDSLELIGEGGMSAIYKARHKIMKRTVAIKLLHSHFHTNTDTIKRFQQEAEAVSAMSHDNVVNVFDFGQLQHGQPYMVMNYVSGISLSQAIKNEGALDLIRSLKIFAQICKGLEHAHKKHIVHRDLKPTNVMLTIDDSDKERAVIVDFGIAKIMIEGDRTSAELTKTGAVIGSPYYMSPEQCLGRPIERSSDIYSLGCLMYETLTGKPIFAGGSSLETMHKHINERPPLLPSLNGNQLFKPHMQAIIHHAVEKEPANRYQKAQDLEHDLSLLLDALQKGIVPKLRSLNACANTGIKPIPLAALGIGIVLCGTQMYYWWSQPADNSTAKSSNNTHHASPKILITDDNSLFKLIKSNPNITELSAVGITGAGMAEIAKLSHIQKLSLRGCTADDTALSVLAKLTKLEDLSLKDSKLDDKGMEELGKITSLRKLLVSSNSMTDAGFASLSQLKNLQELTVQNIKLLGPGVRRLSELPYLTSLCLEADSAGEIRDGALQIISEALPNLTTLKLESTQLTDEGLACLPRFQKLKRLSVAFSPKITDKGMPPIAQLKLSWLNVNGTEITDEGLKALSVMKGLEQMFFWHTRVTDAGMVYLDQMKTLKVLHLTKTAIDDAGLAKLSNLQDLRDLKLRGTKVTDDGLNLLKHFPKLEKLSLQELPITDNGIKALSEMPALAELDLSSSEVTSNGLKQLAALQTLRNLYLKDCSNISAGELDVIKQELPRVKIDMTQFMPSRALE